MHGILIRSFPQWLWLRDSGLCCRHTTECDHL